MSEENVKETITIKKSDMWKYSTFVLAALLVIGGFVFFLRDTNTNSPTTANVVNNGAQQLPTPPLAKVEIGDSPVIGDKNAPVTIIEFSDFSCPFCGAASGDALDVVASMKQRDPSWEAPVPGIMKDYVATGKVRFAYKFSYGHSGGKPAFLVGLCLNDQNLFWKFHNAAFAHQSDVEDLSKMKDLAKVLKADMTKLNSCLDSKKYDARIDKEMQEGVAAGVQGTPAFFVNGELVSGAVSYAQMKKIIESKL
ncbi:MAG: DsbA family protein [Nanoarchaeota archaeon]|nr:DsbA family protein [Nanoarchaeota archaeon]